MYLSDRLTRKRVYRKFGGYPFVDPMRNISTNMRVTAKQSRYSGINKIYIFIECVYENDNRKGEKLCVELLVIQEIKK